MLVTYQHRRGIFIAPFNRRHIGQPERFALSYNGCIADLLQLIKRAVEADKHLGAPGLNRARCF